MVSEPLSPGTKSQCANCDEMAQMVERWTVEPENLGSNPATGEFFRAMLQRVTNDRVYKIPTKWTYN